MTAPASLPVKLQPSNTRPIAYRILSKKHGLNIQTEALTVLTTAIGDKFGAEWRGPKAQNFIEEIAKTWKQQERGLFIDGPGLQQVIREISKDSSSSTAAPQPELAQRTDTLVDIEPVSTVKEVVLNWKDYFKFITPDDQPNFVFDRVRKQFSLKPAVGSKLRSSLESSTTYFSSRYHLLRDRISRDEAFQKQSFSSIAALHSNLTNKEPNADITLVKNLLGRDGQFFHLFGLLSKNINGNYVLEDSSDHIELNISQATREEMSFFSTGMFVNVAGVYSAFGGSLSNNADEISGVFYVSTISHPTAERRDVGLDHYGNLDFMGIHNESQKQSLGSGLVKIDRSLKKKLSALEKALTDHRLVFLGADCFLDDAKVMAGLKKFFSRLEDRLVEQQGTENQMTPLALILTGSFVSEPLTATNGPTSSISSSEEYKSHFDSFAELLSNFPMVIKTCKFVLIPGPNDPWQSTHSLGRSSVNSLPQMPIPKVFVTRLERLLPKEHFFLGWNPMRINYISQEIVLFRDDLMNKLKRNDIVFETDLEHERELVEKENLGENKNVENIVANGDGYVGPKTRQARQLVKTILDQGYLQPFLKDLRVVNPNYQHALRIEPLPTTLILMDSSYESFEVVYNGCRVVNIGSILSNKNSKKLNYAHYVPCAKSYEFKELFF